MCSLLGEWAQQKIGLVTTANQRMRSGVDEVSLCFLTVEELWLGSVVLHLASPVVHLVNLESLRWILSTNGVKIRL